jgi:phosphatidylglycerophosphate synthase
VLIIVPHDAGRPGSPSRWTVVGGLPLVRRIALAAQRAGFGRVFFAGARLEEQFLLRAADVTPLAAEPAALRGPGRVVLLADCVVPRPEWLRRLVETPLEPGCLRVEASLAAVLDAAERSEIVTAVAGGGSMAGAVAALRHHFTVVHAPLDPSGRFVISTCTDIAEAETWLLRSLIKPHETFLSRSFERRLSLALTRRLAPTALTPNTMSVVMIAVGVLAAPFFLSARPSWQVAGALLFLLHSILDGCDGELARLKFLESNRGARIDFWGDNIVHCAVFACLAAGWSTHIAARWPLALGALVVGSTLAAAALLQPSASGPPIATRAPGVSRGVVDALSNRNFIYLIILLAVTGRAWWFLVPAAIGTPVFVGLALWTRRARYVAGVSV